MEGINEEIKREIDHGCKIVQMDLFPHQVGGHHCFLIYDESKLCKPLNDQEYKVYQKFPKSLKDFIPNLYGVVKVYFRLLDDDITSFALPPDCSYVKDVQRFENWLQGMRIIHDQEEQTIGGENDTDNSMLFPSKQDISNLRDSWVAIRKNKLKKELKKKDMQKPEKFLLLEDVSRKFKFPCVVDFKMGTRGFGDHDTKEKKERKQKRFDQSTSGTLGVRLCGMQVYHPENERYILTNKYKGREYKEVDFHNSISNFLFNGSTYRTELIQPLVDRLKKLLDCLQEIDGYRFYCSSLLVMYDGDLNDKPHVEVRMVDFAKSVVEDEDTNYHVGPDKGYILGVKSLIDIFSNIEKTLVCQKEK